MLEAHYFQPAMRRFVQKTIDGYKIQVVHPNGFVVSMPIIFAPDDCDLPGMIGLELYEQKLSFGGSGFSFSGPGGIARKNKKGQPIAETLMCMYPRPETFNGKKSLDYKEIK